MVKGQPIVTKYQENTFHDFSKRKQPQSDVNIKIEGMPIEEVDRTKFLGTIIDNKLSGTTY